MISVLIPYREDGGQRDLLLGYVLEWWGHNFPEAEICLGRNTETPFSRSAARNDAAAQAEGDLFVVADADTIPTPAGLRGALDLVAKERCWALPYSEGRYYNLTEEDTARILVTSVIPTPPEPTAWEHKITSHAGCLVMKREAWDAVGGYDERFLGWGHEDDAFRLALNTMWGPLRRCDNYIVHLWHPRGDASFDQPNIAHNQDLFRQYVAAKTRAEMERVLAEAR